jgi:hypothetical protein
VVFFIPPQQRIGKLVNLDDKQSATDSKYISDLPLGSKYFKGNCQLYSVSLGLTYKLLVTILFTGMAGEEI